MVDFSQNSFWLGKAENYTASNLLQVVVDYREHLVREIIKTKEGEEREALLQDWEGLRHVQGGMLDLVEKKVSSYGCSEEYLEALIDAVSFGMENGTKMYFCREFIGRIIVKSKYYDDAMGEFV